MSDCSNCGVYTITAPSGNRYVGSSCNIANRWRRHRREMANGTHNNPLLVNAYKKYDGNLRFDMIIVCEPDHLILYEQIAIDALKPRYNISPTAGSLRGIRYQKSVYASRSIAAKLRRASEETKRLIGLKSKERKFSAESRAKKSASLRATAKLPEVKARVIAAAKLRAANPETRKKISDALRGRKKPPRTLEHAMKIGATKRGKKQSAETIAKRIASRARNLQAKLNSELRLL